MTFNVSTESIALYGAIVASVSIVVSALSLVFQAVVVIRDKKNVRVKMTYDNEIIGGMPLYKENEDYISIDIVNIGRRPVTITTTGLLLYTNKKSLPIDAVRKGRFTLNEGEKETFVMEQKSVRKNTVRCVFATDAEETVYRTNMDNAIWRFTKLFLFKLKIIK
jgi:hypothetical protein